MPLKEIRNAPVFKINTLMGDFVSSATEKVSKGISKVTESYNNMKRRFLNRQDVRKVVTNAERVADSIKDIAEVSDDTGESMTNLQDKIEGLQSQMGRLFLLQTSQYDLFDQIKEVTDETTDRIIALGQGLGYTRAQIIQLIKDTSIRTGIDRTLVNVNDMTESLTALFESGVRNRQMLERLAPVVALFEKSLGVGKESIAARVYELHDRLKLTTDTMMRSAAAIKKASTLVAVSSQELWDSVYNEKLIRSLQMGFARQQDILRNNFDMITTNLAIMTGSMKENWSEAEGIIEKIMESMADPARQQELARILGHDVQWVRQVLTEQGGAYRLMDQFFSRLTYMQQNFNPMEFRRLMEALELDPEAMQNAVMYQQDVLKTIQKLQDETSKLGDSNVYLSKTITDTMKASEMWMNRLSWLTTIQIPLLNMSILDIADTLADIPVSQILFSMTLGAQLLDTSIAKSIGLTAAVEKLTTVITTQFSAATASISATTAASGGLFATFTSGMTAVGTTLVTVAPYLLAFGAAAALIYYNWDRVSAVFSYVYDKIKAFFEMLRGSRRLQSGFLGTIAGIIRNTIALTGLIKDIIRIGVLSFIDRVTNAITGLSNKYNDFRKSIEDWFNRHRDNLFIKLVLGLSRAADYVLSYTSYAVKRLAAGLVNSVIYLFNQSFVAPLNQLIDIVPRTLQVHYGFEKIPELGYIEVEAPSFAEGGIVSEPILATVGDAPTPEVISPLSELYNIMDSFADKIIQNNQPVVNVSNEEVVLALREVRKVLENIYRMQNRRKDNTGWGITPSFMGL